MITPAHRQVFVLSVVMLAISIAITVVAIQLPVACALIFPPTGGCEPTTRVVTGLVAIGVVLAFAIVAVVVGRRAREPWQSTPVGIALIGLLIACIAAPLVTVFSTGFVLSFG